MDSQKLGFIDAVRGIAILLVVLVHQSGAVADVVPLSALGHQIGEYGHMGVQMFFVASALTLGLSYARRRTENQALTRFYLRRLFRIAPMYWLAIGLYFVIATVFIGNSDAFTPVNVAANAVFVHGFVPGAINDVVPGGWSIAGEMFFYSWFPAAFIAASWLYDRHGIWPLMVITGSIFGAYAAAWHLIPEFTVYQITRGNIFYYWAPAQIPVFLIGLTGYFAWRTWAPTNAAVNLAAFMTLTAATVLMWRSGYVAAFAWVPSIAALSFVFLLRGLSTLNRLPSWLQEVGRVSYSMYILHFIVVWFGAPIAISWFAALVPVGDAVLLVTYPVTALVAFCMAWVSTRTIEAWGIAQGRKIIQRMDRRRQALPAI
ncbi:acyltransferase family protein [Brevundimonas sp.]|uniref:acyltransferase family protein n=1 Tax=Brevundimonas sp. TaxID=1871086 RepID=UPI0035164783